MKNLKEGNVVKFVDSVGKLNGGTVICSQKNSKGEEVVLINTLEGENISKYEKDLFLIKRQKVGAISKSFLTEITKEINEANKSKGIEEEIILNRPKKERKVKQKEIFNSPIATKKEEQILPTEQKEYFHQVVNPIFIEEEELQKQTTFASTYSFPPSEENFVDLEREKNLTKIILGLEKALISSLKEDKSEVVEILINLINQTNNIE